MIKLSKPLSLIMFVLALGLGLGSVILFAGAPLGALRILRPDWPLATILLWDTGLSLLFFIQHSGMVRRPFRAWMGRLVDPQYHGAIYGIASGVALAAVVLLWQPSQALIFVLAGPARTLTAGLSLAAFCFFVWAARSLRPFDPLGLAPLLAHLRHRPNRAPVFVARGPYRLVRHPLYLAVLVLIWSNPEMTMDRLLFDLLWTAWIFLGARLEEADLLAEYGDAYRAFYREIPGIIPWRTRRVPALSQGSAVGESAWVGERGEGYVVLQVLLIALVLFGPRTWPGLPAWPASLVRIALPVGIVLMALGTAFMVSGIVALGRNLAAVPRPKQGATLVERGPYRIVRHPMYTGAILIAFGWAFAVSGWLTFLYACLIVVFLAKKTAREERWLCQELPGYVDYQRRVGRLIPFV
jgi:methanethiol S-methyltransferase